MSDGEPSTDLDLAGMAIDFDALLHDTGIVDEDSLDVRETDDPACLLEVTCYAAHGVTVERAAEEVKSVWADHLAYRYFEAHHLHVEPVTAVLEFVTQMQAWGLYVTGRVTVLPYPPP